MRAYRVLDDQGPYCNDMKTSVGVIYYQLLWINIYRYRLDRGSMDRDDFTSLKYSMDKVDMERQ